MEATEAPAPRTFAADEVAHGHALPRSYAERVPASDARILRFLLVFLEAEHLGHASLFVNGGYVRDLLLGKEPDDLDLSLSLRECPDEVTVSALLQKVAVFAAARRDLGIVEVKTATILSNESKDKQLDTFKAHFTDVDGRKIEVDVMPTIGEETYNEGNRTPVRDHRGTPEQDVLRRDLTIGALLLRVGLNAGGTDSSVHQALCFELLDFYGGIEDLQLGVLRSPFPRERSLAAVKVVVLRTAEEAQLAEDFGLNELPENVALQVLWWAKVLMDDPLRICRALRMAAKLRFALHDTFWMAAPFALQALRSKVAGGRKNTEYQKLGGYSFQACTEFFELAFVRTFGPGDGTLRLASGLFGGQDAKGVARTLSEVRGFNLDLFRRLAAPIAVVDIPAVRIGSLLAASIFAAELEGEEEPLAEFQRSCNGMCVSNVMRNAGEMAFQVLGRLSAKAPEPGRLQKGFAAACGVSEETMALHSHVWNAMHLAGASSEWPTEARDAVQHLGLGMLEHSEPALAGTVRGCLEVLAWPRPPVSGKVFAAPGVLEVPPPLRGHVMTMMETALRLLKHSGPVQDAAQLQQLLEEMPLLGEALSASVWFEADGRTLREEFQPPKRGKAAKAK